MYGDFMSMKSAARVSAPVGALLVEHPMGLGLEGQDASHGSSLAEPRSNHARPCSTNRSASAGSYVLAIEPQPHRMLDEEALDRALTLAADFIDMKSPYMGGHSRRCAELGELAARASLGSPRRR